MTTRRFLTAALLSLMVLATGLTFSGCSPKAGSGGAAPSEAVATTTAKSAPCFTKVVYTPSQLAVQCIIAGLSPLQPLTTESASYAQVSRAWLHDYQSTFQARLFAEGVVVSLPSGSSGWSPQFDCVAYTLAFITYAGEQYNRDAFRTENASTALAIVRLEYVRDTDARYAAAQVPVISPEGHAILLIATDLGPVFYDPQTGPVTLLPTELASVFRKQAF